MTVEQSAERGSLVLDNIWKVYPLYASQLDRLKEALSPLRRTLHTNHYALQGVSLTVKPGESLGVIGRNGSGKSTLLKIVSGVASPSAGEVHVGGRVAALLELGAGFNPEFTGRENVFLHGRLHGVPQSRIAELLPDIRAFADIGDFFDQPVKQYSSGMFVRLAFAAAIHTDPDLLIVDEALSVGDAAFQAKCMRRIQRMAANGVTILFVTHDMSVIKRLCSRCLYLLDGTVKALGPAQDVADMYLADMREQMNAEVLAAFQTTGETFHEFSAGVPQLSFFQQARFRSSQAFVDAVADRREGTGQVRIHGVETLDQSGTPCAVFEYDRTILIRLHVAFEADDEVNVGYHVRDARNTELVGTNTVFEDYGLLAGLAGDTYVVDFEFPARLTAGAYNVTSVITRPLFGDEHVVFHDLVEHAGTFTVLQRPVMRLWNSVYLENALTVYYSGNPSLELSCPVCSRDVKAFLPLPQELAQHFEEKGFDFKGFGFETLNYAAYLCPHCGASDRERLVALFLREEFSRRPPSATSILDFAPREGFTSYLRAFGPRSYHSADLFMDEVDLKLDAACMPEIKDASIDLLVALHVLEHIPDDHAAMAEFFRVLTPGGLGVFLVPIARKDDRASECPTASEAERWRRFGQDDHLRQFTRGMFQDRLVQAGFQVHLLDRSHFGLRSFHCHGISESSVLYVAAKPSLLQEDAP